MLLSGVYDWLQNKDTRSPGCDTLTDEKKIKKVKERSAIFFGDVYLKSICAQ